MATKDLLTVKEVAELMGVSRQAIYKRMETDCQPYVVEVDKQKRLDYRVIKHLAVNHSTKIVDSSTEVELLKKLVEIYEKENELKQQTIEQLQKQNEEAHQQLTQLAGQVGSALQSITHGQLADKLIEGKKLIDIDTTPDEPDTPQRSFLKRFFKRTGK